jgi:IS5 family transposase
MMSDQRTFAGMAWAAKKKVTRREQFLAEMDAVIPWARLRALIAPHYPKAGNGRPPRALDMMLRIYFLQQWFALSDPQAEEMLYDSESMRRFVGLELSEETAPDETTILHFRHLLERHKLTARLFTEVRTLLEERRLLLTTGTIMDATIIHAPSSTKNATKTRDPEMHQTKKGNQWYFGMKVHVGTDTNGVVHTTTVTDAATADITQVPDLLRGTESSMYGDKAYWSEADREACAGTPLQYRIIKKAKDLSERDEAINTARARVRAMVEHPFLVMKRLWGYTTVRYRGLEKNRAQVFTLLALTNLYRMRYRLMPALQHRRVECLI